MKALSTFRNLTGGRLPPLTRTALLAGLSLFVLTLLVFRPTAGGVSPAPALAGGVYLVPPGDARTESFVLLDTSVVFFPSRSSLGGGGQGEIGQPEDTPFAKSEPVLQLDPLKTPASALRTPEPIVPRVASAIPLSQSEPFTTFGAQRINSQSVPARVAYFEVYPSGGALKPILYGKITHLGVDNSIKTKNNSFKSISMIILGVDSLGKATLGSLLHSSGDLTLDKMILGWAAGVNWSGQLTPGSYRLQVGP